MCSGISRSFWAGVAGVFLSVGCSSAGDHLLGRVLESSDSIQNIATDASVPIEGGSSAECENVDLAPPKALDLALFPVIDRAASMQDPTYDKWELFVNAYTHFLQSGVANGTSLGLSFFPVGAFDEPCQRNDPRPCPRPPSCDPNLYARPQQQIQKLPDNYATLAGAIFQRSPAGPTVIRTALEGARNYGAGYAATHPTQLFVPILMAGGPPSTDACQPDGIADCLAIVRDMTTKTYVIAVGTDKAVLDPIAAAGGTKEAIFLDLHGMMPDRLADIMSNIIEAEKDCAWAVPSMQPGFDSNKLNVEVTGLSELPLPVTLRKVKGRQACDAEGGWYYDQPFHPARIIACDTTCQAIRGRASVKLSLGCQTITAASAK